MTLQRINFNKYIDLDFCSLPPISGPAAASTTILGNASETFRSTYCIRNLDEKHSSNKNRIHNSREMLIFESLQQEIKVFRQLAEIDQNDDKSTSHSHWSNKTALATLVLKQVLGQI